MATRTDKIFFCTVVLGTMFMGGTDGHTSGSLKNATFEKIGSLVSDIKTGMGRLTADFAKPREDYWKERKRISSTSVFRNTGMQKSEAERRLEQQYR